MSISASKPSFGGVYVSQTGLEKLRNGSRVSHEKLEMLQDVAQNKEDSVNDFILDDNGNFKIRNEKYGTFCPANPPNANVSGNVFTCDIWDKDGNQSPFRLRMKDAKSAEALEKNFWGGTPVYGGVVALYNAMNATAAYEKEQQKLMEQKNQQMCDNILSLTQPYVEE